MDSHSDIGTHLQVLQCLITEQEAQLPFRASAIPAVSTAAFRVENSGSADIISTNVPLGGIITPLIIWTTPLSATWLEVVTRCP